MVRRRHWTVRAARAVFVPAICVLGTAYFAGHAVYGDYGMNAKLRLERELETSQRALLLVREERRLLERDVALMRPDSLDPDLLEERVRATLNYAAPDDIIVLTNDP